MSEGLWQVWPNYRGKADDIGALYGRLATLAKEAHAELDRLSGYLKDIYGGLPRLLQLALDAERPAAPMAPPAPGAEAVFHGAVARMGTRHGYLSHRLQEYATADGMTYRKHEWGRFPVVVDPLMPSDGFRIESEPPRVPWEFDARRVIFGSFKFRATEPEPVLTEQQRDWMVAMLEQGHEVHVEHA